MRETYQSRQRVPAASCCLALSLLLAAAACQAADSAPPSPPGSAKGQPPGPPPEAIAACQGKAVGATASFTGRNGETISGSCQYTGSSQSQSGSSQVLALRPDRMPAPPQGQQR